MINLAAVLTRALLQCSSCVLALVRLTNVGFMLVCLTSGSCAQWHAPGTGQLVDHCALPQMLVKTLLQKVWDKGDIYKAKYEGLSLATELLCQVKPKAVLSIPPMRCIVYWTHSWVQTHKQTLYASASLCISHSP